MKIPEAAFANAVRDDAKLKLRQALDELSINLADKEKRLEVFLRQANLSLDRESLSSTRKLLRQKIATLDIESTELESQGSALESIAKLEQYEELRTKQALIAKIERGDATEQERQDLPQLRLDVKALSEKINGLISFVSKNSQLPADLSTAIQRDRIATTATSCTGITAQQKQLELEDLQTLAERQLSERNQLESEILRTRELYEQMSGQLSELELKSK